MESFQGRLDVRQWVVVLHCVLVKLAVVHDDMLLLAILLVDKIDRGCHELKS